jgi:integrase
MSVTVRAYRRGGWMVDINTRLSNGTRYRERKRLSIPSKSAAQRWGQDRERHVLQHGPPQPKKEVPTLAEFAPRFIEGHARANRQKPSGIVAKESILNVHLVPLLGSKRLDEITNEQVQGVKRHLADRAPKTVNNVLTVLNTLLKKALEWDVIELMPCTIRLLRTCKPSASFYDFEEYERLVEAARQMTDNTYLVVLLGGEAGLRCGEIIGLEWSDVDFGRRQLCIQRSEWRGHVHAPKGGRLRHVPLTVRLATALRDRRHLRGSRVVSQRDGSSLTHNMVGDAVRRAARRANLAFTGVHRLRHTFCSHLAMRGAPARAIQELAGHQDLTTTQRYMHLSPAAIESAIRLLDHTRTVAGGNIVATAGVAIGKALIQNG